MNENFYKWFEDSKATQNNEPVVYFHKSRHHEKFDIFSCSEGIKNPYNNCHGFYFVAKPYKHCIEYIGQGVEFYVYLRMNNPFYIYDDGLGRPDSFKDMDGGIFKHHDIHEPFYLEIKDRGFDSVIIENWRYYNQYIVFHPNQIKSVDNNGNYSKESNNIFE